MGSNGTMCTLEYIINVQDQNIDGVCPICIAQTPFSSEGSHLGPVENWKAIDKIY
jgi:hypothetical protein